MIKHTFNVSLESISVAIHSHLLVTLSTSPSSLISLHWIPPAASLLITGCHAILANIFNLLLGELFPSDIRKIYLLKEDEGVPNNDRTNRQNTMKEEIHLNELHIYGNLE